MGVDVLLRPNTSTTGPDAIALPRTSTVSDADLRRTTMNDVKVSLAEILEVRGGGLDAHELLALATVASGKLPNCPRGKLLFDVEHVYITNSGNVVIEPISTSKVDEVYFPPEWALGESDDVAAAVYCMGAVMRQAGAEQTEDADLFSLVNILTVAMIGTRPTPTRMGQMAKNQLKGQDPKQILQDIYVELMGDDEENQLSDDYSEEDFDMDMPSGANGRRSQMFDSEEEHHVNDIGSPIGNSTRIEEKPIGLSPSHSASGITVKRAAITVDDDDDDYEDALSEEDEISSSSSEDERNNPFKEPLSKPVAVPAIITTPVTPPKVEEVKEIVKEERPIEEIKAEKVESKVVEPKTVDKKADNPFFEDNFTDSVVASGSTFESSTRINTTMTSSHTSFTSTPTVTAPSRRKHDNVDSEMNGNPFDEEEENSERHRATLSGRDPFEEARFTPPRATSPVKTRHQLPDIATMMGNGKEDLHEKKLQHKMSSEEDDIVEAHLSDEEMFPVGERTEKRNTSSYFEDVMSETQKKEEKIIPPSEPQPEKRPPWTATVTSGDSRGRTPASSTSSSISPVSSAKEDESSHDRDYLPSPEPAPRSKPDLLNNNRVKTAVEERRAGLFEKKKSRAEALNDRKSNPFDDTGSETESDSDVEPPSRRKHVDAQVVVTQTPTPPTRRTVPRKVEETTTEEADETNLDDMFNEARAERRKSALPVLPPPGLVKAAATPTVSNQNTPQFSRRNSLQANRISGRKPSMRKRKTRAEPEFVEKSSLPCIRLKAPHTKRKKMSLHRVEQADVWVELLNGQKVEVSCRSDALAQDIFGLVVGHMNINEHVFFGLSTIRDGEHFFLDDNQKLEKFAPPGWRNSSKQNARNQYLLHLRFRFYPQILEFIKTEVTVHELYLQLRRDVLADRIQPKKDTAFELAALALQSEFGERPPPAVKDYFGIEYYLNKRFYQFEESDRVQSVLGELHSHYSGMKSREVECKYIQICQTLPDYGGHIHRVFRTKPSSAHASSPFDPDTGANMFISIMPKGIIVQEEQGGIRTPLAQHIWQKTQTLQFDKKKFVIVAAADGHQTETVFYTDHFSKSSYFVRFSASQHRFMMRMRQWKNTLRSERSIAGMPDVAVEGTMQRERNNAPPVSPLEKAEEMFPKFNRPVVLNVSVASQNRTIESRMNEETSNSFDDRFEEASADEMDDVSGNKFNVILHKDPNAGLGLTLVDGKLNEVAGVYVKSVARDGAGERSGLLVGDRLISVNGTSLVGSDRHRAVELVKASGPQVKIEIARLDAVGNHAKQASGDMSISSGKLPMPKISNASTAESRDSGPAGRNLGLPPQKGVSRTPPAPRKMQNKRVRAVSDFGAIGDMLPTFNSEDIIADKMRAISGLHLDDSDEETGAYHLPSHSMYSFDHHEDESPTEGKGKKSMNDSFGSSPGSSVMSPNGGDRKKKYSYSRKSNLDWADELEELGEEDEDDDLLTISLARNDTGSLGVQIASVGGQVCIKQLTAEPALSANIQVGDVLVAVDGVTTAHKTHQEVVQMLRSGGQRVKLALRREGGGVKERTLKVVLNKPEGGSLGLSLAKRTGFEGIYIRMIGANSAAEEDGTLKVGDRIWEMDGVNVADSSPGVIVEKLKAVRGPIEIVVKRPTDQ